MKEIKECRSISSQTVCDTAKDMWYEVTMINKSKNLFTVTKENRKIMFRNIDCGINSSLSLKLCDNKELTYNILELNWVRIPKSIYLNLSEIKNVNLHKLELEYPLVVKPVDWAHWEWVYTDIKDIDELNISIDKSFKYSDNIIIQQYIQWDEHRILVIWDHVIYGLKRIPAYVIWNWKNTIKELIDIENKNPMRGLGYEKPMTSINIDENLKEYIDKYYNYNIDTIAKDNEYITLRWVSNIWLWWVPKDVTGELWDELKKECVAITKTLWLKVAGLDIVTSDLSVSLTKSKWVVLEVWATPWFWWDIECTGINPAEHLLNIVFRN